MKITKIVQKEEVITIEIDTPIFYKLVKPYGGINYYQVNSEEDVIEIQAAENFNTVQRLPLNYIPSHWKIFDSEAITESEFNQAFTDALALITNAVPEPLAVAV